MGRINEKKKVDLNLSGSWQDRGRVD